MKKVIINYDADTISTKKLNINCCLAVKIIYSHAKNPTPYYYILTQTDSGKFHFLAFDLGNKCPNRLQNESMNWNQVITHIENGIINKHTIAEVLYFDNQKEMLRYILENTKES